MSEELKPFADTAATEMQRMFALSSDLEKQNKTLKAEKERLLHVIVSFGAENNRLKAENERLKETLRQIAEIANLRFNATVDTLQKNAWYEVAKIVNNALANAPDMDDGRKRVIVEVENSDGEKVVFTVPYSEKQVSIDYETNMPEFEKK
ncbi:MAG: hypothetical protein IJW05_12275 [Lentisphaeria bacterium]|nr:hypothetical protein [Lentisphaeria bacterium]